MHKNTFIASIFCILTLYSLGQYSPEYHKYKVKYPNSSQVQLINRNVIELNIKNGEIKVLEKKYSERIYLNSTAKYQSKGSVHYSYFYDIDKLEASSVNYDNGKYKEYKVTDFKVKDELGTSTFYDDNKSLNFFYPGLGIGSKTKLSYNTIIKNPRFLGGFYFGDFHPIDRYELTVIADKNIHMNFIEMYTDTFNIKYEKIEKGNKIIYKWEKQNINSYVSNSEAINHRYRIPHIIPHIKYFIKGNDTTFVLNAPSDLYKWYASLTKDINTEPCDKNLKILVDSLTKGLHTDLDKVKSIYYWTQQNIKYVAFEDGLGGFIPRNANDVYRKKYGDCKDNSSLLMQMLHEAGLKGHLTWIGTRSIPYSYNQVYTPLVDNHMILTFFDNDKTYFLDATGRFLDINLPSSFIQGKEALVAMDDNNFKIIKVPEVEFNKNSIKENITLTIDSNNTLHGKSSRVYTGYEKTNIFNRIENIKKEDKLKDYYKNMLEKGNNNFLLDSFYEVNKFEYDEAFKINYSFNIKNYANKNEDKIYINLNIDPYDVAAIKPPSPPKATIDYSHMFLGQYETTFEIPDGYTVEYIPENTIIENDLCDIKIEYYHEGNKIKHIHTLSTHFMMITVSQQKELNKLIEKVQRQFKEVLVLKKI